MKAIIGIVVMIAIALGGSIALMQIRDAVRRAALEKASEGLPSLTQMTRSLQKQNGDPAGKK